MPDLHLVTAVLSIVVIDLVLSGDNAVVIGTAARSLPPANRHWAIMLGGVGAVALRIACTILAALLLTVPFLQAAGGLLLLWIADKLIAPQGREHMVKEAGTLGQAIATIMVADAVMSLDNILAVGGASHGSLELLIFGLMLSIPLLLLGSELVARLLGRFPALVYVGALILVLTAVDMILGAAGSSICTMPRWRPRSSAPRSLPRSSCWPPGDHTRVTRQPLDIGLFPLPWTACHNRIPKDESGLTPGA